MLRLSCRMSVKDFSRITNYFSCEPLFKQYEQFGINEFKFNYAYKDDLCSFWFGFISNSEFIKGNASFSNPLALHNFTIEFNPNKCKDNKFLMFILKQMNDIRIVSCDLACDLPYNINQLEFIPQNKSFKHFFDTPDGLTYYFGKGDKRIKIYDKTKEANLDFDLTRIEISVKVDLLLKDIKSVDFSKLTFPIVSCSEYQTTLDDNDIDATLKVHLFALEHGYPLPYMSRVYQKKLKDFKIKKSPIEFNTSTFNKTLINYIDYYFHVNDYI